VSDDTKGPPSDLSTVDIISIVLILLMLAIYCVGAASSNQVLIWTAIAIGFPGAVMKVRSSRAKSRWWYEHGDAWRARQKDNQPQN
jgi:hypothetical protein